MFHSARLKLTGFYLAILLCFSLTLSIGIRELAWHEYKSSSDAQRDAVRVLEKNSFGVPEAFILPPKPYNDFTAVQQDEDSLVSQHLNQDLIMLNLAALVIGGLLSYWYAGRTLKPIFEAHDAQKRFAADASHELRTPLANMQIENEVFLRQRSFTEQEARELIASNLEEVQRLENLAGNLLSLTQYENTSLELTAVPIDTLLKDVLAHNAKALKGRKVKVDQDVTGADVLGHRESLERLVTIVIDNAIKYGPEGGTIFIKGKKANGRYALSVRDEGPGVAANDLPHIFDRLYRGDKARTTKADGYGLGLALAKQIAIANQASIEAGNAKPHGAVFTIDLSLK